MAEGEAKEKKETETKGWPQKRPSALKRDLQNERRQRRNRSLRSSIHTAVRSLEGAIAKTEAKEAVQGKLRSLYSIVDKGVKLGVIKPRKAARTKSRLSLRCAKG